MWRSWLAERMFRIRDSSVWLCSTGCSKVNLYISAKAKTSLVEIERNLIGYRRRRRSKETEETQTEETQNGISNELRRYQNHIFWIFKTHLRALCAPKSTRKCPNCSLNSISSLKTMNKRWRNINLNRKTMDLVLNSDFGNVWMILQHNFLELYFFAQQRDELSWTDSV